MPRKVGIYDTTVSDSDMKAIRAKAESVNKAIRINLATFNAAVRGMMMFILGTIEDTRVRTYKDPIFAYSRITSLALLKILQSLCLGCHATDHVNLLGAFVLDRRPRTEATCLEGQKAMRQ